MNANELVEFVIALEDTTYDDIRFCSTLRYGENLLKSIAKSNKINASREVIRQAVKLIKDNWGESFGQDDFIFSTDEDSELDIIPYKERF